MIRFAAFALAALVFFGAGGRPAQAQHRDVRFLRTAGASLLGGALGGGLGLLVGQVDFSDLRREGRRRSDEDDSRILAAVPGVWVGAAIGAMAGARFDVEQSPLVFWSIGGATVLGSLAGLGAGAGVSGGRLWAGGSGFLLGAASGAAVAVWGLAYAHRGRSALLNLGEGGAAALRVPAVRRASVPLANGWGWRVALVKVRL